VRGGLTRFSRPVAPRPATCLPEHVDDSVQLAVESLELAGELLFHGVDLAVELPELVIKPLIDGVDLSIEVPGRIPTASSTA
jgi:hypothetical protein